MAGQTKQRHGCLTAYLVVMIVASSLSTLSYFLAGDFLRQTYPNAPAWALPFLGILGVLVVVCAVALLKWKKWGFFLWVGLAIIAFFVNLIVGLGLFQSVFGLLGIAILYGVLQIGKENKGWPQLE
jgi:hypothetical protein